MKHAFILTAVLISAASFTSCKPAAEQPADRPAGPAETTRDAVRDAAASIQDEAGDAADELQDFTYEQRANYIAAARVKVEALKRRLESLTESVEKSSEAVKADSRPRIAALRERLAALEAQLDKAERTGADSWDRFKSDLRHSYAEVKEGFREARQWVGEKISP